MDVALANPDVIIVTRDGDRFASSGWRIASGRAVVTRSAVEESQSAARDATAAVAPVRERRKVADAAAIDARQVLNRATSSEAQSLAESERLAGEERRLTEVIDQLGRAEESLNDDLAELIQQIVTNDEELLALREQLPALEEAVATSGERDARVADARRELEALRSRVNEEATRALASRGGVLRASSTLRTASR